MGDHFEAAHVIKLSIQPMEVVHAGDGDQVIHVNVYLI